jgi:SAM-dependent methyltransferase
MSRTAAVADRATTVLCGQDGTVVPLDVDRWSAPADRLERRRLADVASPVLDIGCGPGRLVVALSERGIPAMGVDASPVAVAKAIERNAAALVRSVFDPVPGTGRWRTALLFDGNVGIGGEPLRLLRRVAELLGRSGHLLVEAAAPDQALHRFAARVECGSAVSDWFPWAIVGVEALAAVAVEAGFAVTSTTEDGGRWFLDLELVT